jgi:ferredoxin
MTKAIKIAVIGAGPAAFGTIARLVQYKKDAMNLDIHVFSSGDADQEDQIVANYQERYEPADINDILKRGKSASNSGILPPRSFFKQAIEAHLGHESLKTGVKVSNTFGGIGNYWSSSVLPTHSIKDSLGDELGVLPEHYKFIADRIKISGSKNDSFTHFFDDASVNSAPISLGDGLSRLMGCWDRVDGSSLDLAFGVNRFAINTDLNDKNSCNQCGDCMYGCPRDAMFRAAKPIADFARTRLCNIVYEEVLSVKSQGDQVLLSTRLASHVFDKVFICSGALGSTSLLGRSYGAPDKAVELYDNLLWYFPAFSILPKSVRDHDKRVAFAEVAGGIYDHSDDSYNHLLISSLPDAVLDNVMGRNAVSKTLTRLMSRHLLIGAMYGSREEYIRYNVSPIAGEWKVTGRSQSVDTIGKTKFAAFQKSLALKGWHTHKSLVKENETSGHYSANLGVAYGIAHLAQHGRFDENVYVCDSSTWNGASMSQQHTFSIMANAVRLVQGVFN